MKTLKIFFVFIFFVPASVFAQVISLNADSLRIDKLNKEISSSYKNIKQKVQSNKKPVINLSDDAHVNEYVNNNQQTYSYEQFKSFLKQTFAGNDLILFGENHTQMLPTLETLMLIYDYNNQTKNNKVTDIVFEGSDENFAYIPVFKDWVNKAPQAEKMAVCEKIGEDFKKKNPIYAGYFYAICALLTQGVEFRTPDLAVNENTAYENPICAHLKDQIKYTSLSPVTAEGVNLRNYALIKDFQKLVKPGNKVVFFGGAFHIGFNNVENNITLSELAGVQLPKNTKTISILHLGGQRGIRDAKAPNFEECKEINISNTALTSFFKFIGNGKDDFKIIPFTRYSNKPADYMILYPQNI